MQPAQRKDCDMSLMDVAATKTRGGYYTPLAVADWLASWAIRSPNDRVLEPSCGDGAFLVATTGVLKRRRTSRIKAGAEVVGVELVADEASRAAARAGKLARVVV